MMKLKSNDPSLVSLSISLYSVLLATYPSGFRHEHGSHMVQVFRDICLRSYTLDGLPGMLDLWTLTLLDYFKSVVEEYLQKGIHMSKSTFIRLSGWSLVVGAIAFMVVIVAFSRDVPEYNPYNALSRPIDLYFEYAVTILLPISMFLWLIGMIGLYQRYKSKMNGYGRFGLIIGIFGGGISFLVTLAWSIQSILFSDADFWIFIGGLSLYFLGLIFFGVITMKDHLLPRWNALPLIAGGWLLFLWLINILGLGDYFDTGTGSGNTGQIILLVVSLFSMLGLAALGVTLKSDTYEEAALA